MGKCRDHLSAVVAATASVLAMLGSAALAVPAHAAPAWLPKGALALDSSHEAHGVQVAMDGVGDATALFNVTSGAAPTAQSVFSVDRPAGGNFAPNFTDMTGGPVPAAQNGSFDGQLAADAAGDAAAVWTIGSDNSGHTEIQIQTRRAGGNWSPSQTEGSVNQFLQWPSVALDGAGHATVAWAGGPGTIQAITQSANGSWPAIQQLGNFAVDPNGREPTVAVDARGDRAVAWVGSGSQGGDEDDEIEVNTAAAGGAFGPPHLLKQINSQVGNDSQASRPAVGIDQNGTATVVWGEGPTEGGLATLDMATVPVGVTPSPTSAIVISNPDVVQDPELTPAFAEDARGDAVVLWASGSAIRATFRPAGGSFGAPQTVWTAPSPISQVFGIDAAIDPQGDVLATWSVDTAPHSVYVAAHPAGGPWIVPAPFTSAAADPVPTVAVDGAGDGIVAWSPQFGDTTTHVVEFAGYDAVGPVLHSVSAPSTGVAGSPVSFSAFPLDVWSGLTPATWSFGDGGSATGAAVQHTYAAAGTYTVTLTSTDAVGNATTTTRTITVSPAPPPLVVTGGSVAVGMTSATITATVNPLGQPTTFHFQWGRSPAYGSVSPGSDAAVGSDASNHVVRVTLTHLSPRTTYHYRVTATYCGGCAFGSAVGADASFTTGTPPPLPSNLTWTDAVGRTSTKLSDVILHVVRGAGSVAVTCSGGGCPAKHWRVKTTATTKHCRHHKCTRKVTVLHSINVTGKLAHHPLRPGAVVTVVVTKTGFASKVLTITIRRRREPSFQGACTLPGSSSRFSC